jgi:hypothetical protein
MTPDRSTRRLVSLLATGTFLVVALAFAVPAVLSAISLWQGGLSTSARKEALLALSICGICSLIGFVGFIKFLLIATGRKAIVWSFDDHRPTTVDGKTEADGK